MEEKPKCPRLIAGLLAALPFLIPQLIYLSNIHGWNVALSYGLIFVALVAPFVLLLVYALIEKKIRKRFTKDAHQTPWFSIIGLAFVVSFFFTESAARPFVLKIPDWCRVHQVVRWETSKAQEKYSGMHHYVLVLIGRGNVSEHQFISGYLNWSGDEAAGFSSVKPSAEVLSYYGGANYSEIPLSLSVIKERIKNSGIPGKEVNEISNEIFDTIRQARDNKPIEALSGEIDPLWEAPFSHEDTVLGASIWMLFLVGSFQIVAFTTLPPASQKAEQYSGHNSGGCAPSA